MNAAWILVPLPIVLIYLMPKLVGWRRPTLRAVTVPFFAVGTLAAAYMWIRGLESDVIFLASAVYGSLGALLFHRRWNDFD